MLLGVNYSTRGRFQRNNGTVLSVCWAIDTEGGHMVVFVPLIRNGYEYGRHVLISNNCKGDLIHYWPTFKYLYIFYVGPCFHHSLVFTVTLISLHRD